MLVLFVEVFLPCAVSRVKDHMNRLRNFNILADDKKKLELPIFILL